VRVFKKQVMKRSWWRQGFLAAALATGLSSCFWFDENDTTGLGGKYQLVATSDGNNFLYFEDPEAPAAEPLLSGVSAVGTTATCLVVGKAGYYYVFSLRQPTHEAARATQIGPLTKAALRPKLYQVTGDSMLALRPI
jgi:hypothetical protein